MLILPLELITLRELAYYVRNQVNAKKCDIRTYVSTESMVSDKGGILVSESIPLSGNVNCYCPGDILISNIRPYFKKIWKANRYGHSSNDVVIIRAKDPKLSDYLFAILSDDRFFDYVMQGSKGTKMPRGDKEQIMDYQFFKMDKESMIKIGHIDSTIASYIEVFKTINDNLETMCQAKYEDLIQDLEISGLKCNLSDLGDIVGGGTPSKSIPEYYCESGIPWITPKDLSINKSKFISKGNIDLTKLGLNNSGAKIMPRGSILYTSRAPIGYIAISKNDVCTNQGFKSIIPKKPYYRSFIYYYLKNNINLVNGVATGSTFLEISGTAMKRLPIIKPSNEEAESFESFCKPFFKEQELLEAKTKQLLAVRNYLLSKLMTGEIDVSTLELPTKYSFNPVEE